VHAIRIEFHENIPQAARSQAPHDPIVLSRYPVDHVYTRRARDYHRWNNTLGDALDSRHTAHVVNSVGTIRKYHLQFGYCDIFIEECRHL
jgi:hypothetical protein